MESIPQPTYAVGDIVNAGIFEGFGEIVEIENTWAYVRFDGHYDYSCIHRYGFPDLTPVVKLENRLDTFDISDLKRTDYKQKLANKEEQQ